MIESTCSCAVIQPTPGAGGLSHCCGPFDGGLPSGETLGSLVAGGSSEQAAVLQGPAHQHPAADQDCSEDDGGSDYGGAEPAGGSQARGAAGAGSSWGSGRIVGVVLGAVLAPGGGLQGKGAWVAERSKQLLFPGSLQTELNGGPLVGPHRAQAWVVHARGAIFPKGNSAARLSFTSAHF